LENKIIIDTHCHAGINWFEPIEILILQMEMNNVNNAILIQHAGVYDNSYLVNSLRKYPGKFKACGMINPDDPNPIKTLLKLKEEGISGIRLNSNINFSKISQNDFIQICGEYGIVISYQGNLNFFSSDYFRLLIRNNPKTKIVIEHLAGIGYKYPAEFQDFKNAIKSLQMENVYIKIPGLGEIVKRPEYLTSKFHFEIIPPLIDTIYKTYGSEKMMWGSDFPPCSNREGYKNTLLGIMNYPIFKTSIEVDNIMGKTAEKVWGFN